MDCILPLTMNIDFLSQMIKISSPLQKHSDCPEIPGITSLSSVLKSMPFLILHTAMNLPKDSIKIKIASKPRRNSI